MYDVDGCGLAVKWRETDKIHGKCLKKILRMPSLAARVSRIEIRNCKCGEALCAIVKYWLRPSCVDIHYAASKFTLANKSNVQSGLAKLKEEIKWSELSNIWQMQSKKITEVCSVIKDKKYPQKKIHFQK